MPSFTRPPAAPHKPCLLAHHDIGRRVIWTEGLIRMTGTVLGHRQHQRVITIIADSGGHRLVSCGGVAAL